MKLYNVGILGATGAVGQEMMKILLERKFPVGGQLHLVAGEGHTGAPFPRRVGGQHAIAGGRKAGAVAGRVGPLPLRSGMAERLGTARSAIDLGDEIGHHGVCRTGFQ